MKRPQMGLHTQEERNRAYQRAKHGHEEGMKSGGARRAFYIGYLQAIEELAHDHNQDDLAQLVQDLRVAVEYEASKEFPRLPPL